MPISLIRRREKMSKWLKTAFVAILLMAAGHFFGTICRQIGQEYELIFSPSKELLGPLLRFLVALCAVAVATGLVAALVRPVFVAIIAVALSGATMLLGWQVAKESGILVGVYFLAGSVYVVGVARELSERISFSVRPISQGQGMLLMALVLVVCGSIYLSSAARIKREGFSIPEPYIEMFMEQMEKQVAARMPEEGREEALTKFREEFRRSIDGFFERTVKPYERLIPLAIAIGLFTPLVTITRLLAWLPTMVMSILFFLLTELGMTEVVYETQEVERLVIG